MWDKRGGVGKCVIGEPGDRTGVTEGSSEILGKNEKRGKVLGIRGRARQSRVGVG